MQASVHRCVMEEIEDMAESFPQYTTDPSVDKSRYGK